MPHHCPTFDLFPHPDSTFINSVVHLSNCKIPLCSIYLFVKIQKHVKALFHYLFIPTSIQLFKFYSYIFSHINCQRNCLFFVIKSFSTPRYWYLLCAEGTVITLFCISKIVLIFNSIWLNCHYDRYEYCMHCKTSLTKKNTLKSTR